MKDKYIAKSEIKIKAPLSKVWDSLVNPAIIKKYMFGTNVESEWKEGSKITWKGEWQGKKYEDDGKILKFVPNKLLQYTHFSPLSGIENKPENYNTVTVMLEEENNSVNVSLTQDNNNSIESKEHSEKNWEMVLKELKKLLEN